MEVIGGPSSTDNGVLTDQLTCNGQSNQSWNFKDAGNGLYQIIASNSGRCLDVPSGDTADGVTLQQWDCAPGDKQLWRLQDRGNGYYNIISAATNKCVDVAGQQTIDGATVQQWTCNNQDNQLWTLTPPTQPTDFYKGAVSVKHSQKCLNVENAATDNGAQTSQLTCSAQPNQSWTFKDTGGGLYQIIADHSGKCLDVPSGNSADGVTLQQWDCAPGNKQLWRLQDEGGGYYKIISAETNKCVDVAGIQTIDGAKVQQWTCLDQDNQRWQLKAGTDTGTPTCTPPQVLQNGQCVTPPPSNSPMPTIAGSTTEQQAFWNNFNTTMILQDEFDGSTLNSSIWKHGDSLGFAPSNPSAVQVNNGMLRLVVPGGEVGISSIQKFTAGYFIEGRARMPTGPGVWPAFWLIQVNDTGGECNSRAEPDIFEAYPGYGGVWDGSPNPDFGGVTVNRFDFTHHPVSNAAGCGDIGQQHMSFENEPFNPSTTFATYGMWHRKDGQVEFYLNGVKRFTSSTNPVLAEKLLELVINNVSQSRIGGAPISSAPQDNRNALEFDYVRVWSEK